MKEEFVSKIDDQKLVHKIIKSIVREIRDPADRSVPFDYDRFVAMVDEEIKEVRTKVSPGF